MWQGGCISVSLTELTAAVYLDMCKHILDINFLFTRKLFIRIAMAQIKTPYQQQAI